MLQRLRTRASEEEGFTLIELLVVILIIGILAAIALPTFLGQKDKAKDASAKSNARNAVSQMESCLTNTPTVTCPDADSPLPANTVNSTVDSSGNYSVTATSDSNTRFRITKTGTTFTRSCGATDAVTVDATNTKGGCPAGGVW